MKVALVVIYNHQFNQNIPIVEKIYGTRFSSIFHLVPFYKGNQSNVIPVYENSKYFEGYVAQGCKLFFNEKYDHYLFLADDLILNPIINENNYKDFFDINNRACFIPRLDSLHLWSRYNVKLKEAAHYKIRQSGVEIDNLLPSYDTALRRLKYFNVEVEPLRFMQITPKQKSVGKKVKRYLKQLKNIGRHYQLDYPLTGSYSDIFIVDKSTIRDFSFYCGIFSATNLFAELAIPTALALSATNIVLEKELEFRGRALWDKNDYAILDVYGKKLDRLLKNFPKNVLYLHPIKLSQWNCAL